MIIRHAEKPDGSAPGLDEDGNEDDSSLTAVGWQRARGLVDLFDPTQGDPRPGIAVPERIYAAGVTDDGEGQRTRETVAPLGTALGVPVDTDLGRGDEKKLVKCNPPSARPGSRARPCWERRSQVSRGSCVPHASCPVIRGRAAALWTRPPSPSPASRAPALPAAGTASQKHWDQGAPRPL